MSAYPDYLPLGPGPRPIDGAEDAIRELRAVGLKVALTTGFSPDTRDAVLDALGWRGIADAALSPADAGRGRPFPDMILTAALRLGVTDVRDIAAAGDTTSDVLAGLRAGARISAGVLTGTHREFPGATHVVGSVAEIPALVLAA